jgi:hypothetical protein
MHSADQRSGNEKAAEPRRQEPDDWPRFGTEYPQANISNSIGDPVPAATSEDISCKSEKQQQCDPPNRDCSKRQELVFCDTADSPDRNGSDYLSRPKSQSGGNQQMPTVKIVVRDTHDPSCVPRMLRTAKHRATGSGVPFPTRDSVPRE